MDPLHRPIGVFDSGVGGISVLKELVRYLPKENFLYFGDSANAPYGVKTPEEVLDLTEKALLYFMNEGCKAMVIACNTATSAAAAALRKKYADFPIIGIEPAIKPAASFLNHPKVLVLATPMTLHLEKFMQLEEKWATEADFEALPCPELVTLIENGLADSPETENYLQKKLAPYLSSPPDAIVLGCTHFPFVKPVLSRIFQNKVRFFDGAEGTAKQLKRKLEEKNLLSNGSDGWVRFSSSNRSPEILLTMERLLNR